MKQDWKPGTLIYPLPSVMVSCLVNLDGVCKRKDPTLAKRVKRELSDNRVF